MTQTKVFRSLLVALILVGLGRGTEALAGPTSAQRCLMAKRLLVGRAFAVTAKCDGKAARKGTDADPACLDRAASLFSLGWAQLDATNPVGCAMSGDATTVEDLLAAQRAELGAALVTTGPPSGCTGAKFKSTGDAVACGMRCVARAAHAGVLLDDPEVAACAAVCNEKFSTRFGKAEFKGPGACRSSGDVVAIAAKIDAFVAALANQLPPPIEHFCDLPGSVYFIGGGTSVVPGGSAEWPSLNFLTLPDGFCAHYYATVGNARQLRFAPGGELFVASPSRPSTGGGNGGRAAIVIVPDDDRDGVGDAITTFQGGIQGTQGLLFANDHLYYQDDTTIRRVPYTAGDRSPSGAAEVVATITNYSSNLHWPKPIDIADDGTIYVGNGGDQGESCVQPPPFRGGILKLDSPHGTPVAGGLRNPIVVRCSRGHNRCFALELAKDYSAATGGREKLLPIHDGDNWGFPCCASQDLPHTDILPVPDCSAVTPENASFVIGDTPFGLDFSPTSWPAPYGGSAIVSLHGVFGSWVGAGMVAIEMDATTGLPLPSSNLEGEPSGAMRTFASGWDDGTRSHGRPADLTFAPDGRLFVANDANGVIFWIAPID